MVSSRLSPPDRYFLVKRLIERIGEWLVVFAVFGWQGAWPVPEVNEPYYLGKAAHFWNPEWCPRDDFFATGDAHEVFYFTFGWLSLILPLPALAWTGRVVTWALLAAGWCFLARRLQLRGWTLVLSGVLFGTFQERLAMAGEWVIGGVEAKGFAYAMVLFGLGTLASGQWRTSLILLGLATAFHVLVGGWSLIAIFLVWLMEGRQPHWKTLLPAAAGALVLALPGIIPSLALTWKVPPEILREANRIYTFERLAHHLVPGCFRPEDITKFLILTGLFLGASQLWRGTQDWQRVRFFAMGSLLIALCGWMLSWTVVIWPDFAAAVLRYYWFRLSDVAVPLGAALWIGLIAGDRIVAPRPFRAALITLAAVGSLLHLSSYVPVRTQPTLPRTEWTDIMWSTWQTGQTAIVWPIWQEDPVARREFRQWLEVCQWISTNTPADARFLTPLTKSTFKWYAGRSEVVTWKEIPQDARSIVAWWTKLKDIYLINDPIRGEWWARNATDLGEARLSALAQKYQFEYILTQRTPPLSFELVFCRPDNDYVVYRVGPPHPTVPQDQPSNRSSP
ncbi:DUF6798 domain-containing protein [Thermogutta sp.]|uniref:DUF6798 domain-containing protein n=1 Tax=Thermogutta sp. TaxID=1962930 RepID=UPI003C7C4C51